MKHFEYQTAGTCSKVISFDLDGSTVHNVEFVGGCPGNLKAIPALIEGADANVVIEKLKGIRCGNKPTSCAHQLTLALGEALNS